MRERDDMTFPFAEYQRRLGELRERRAGGSSTVPFVTQFEQDAGQVAPGEGRRMGPVRPEIGHCHRKSNLFNARRPVRALRSKPP